MSVEFLLQLCAQHGIKLTLASDGSDRLIVDAPKGSLTPSLREALTANKADLIGALKAQAAESETVTEIHPSAPSRTPFAAPFEFDRSKTPAVSSPTPTESRNPSSMTSDRAAIEVKNLLEGQAYDSQVIEAPDAATRQVVSTELMAALGRNNSESERAREAFMEHGYFDEATRDLRTADSPGERAAAARKLGAIKSRLATTHVAAALHDSAPEVRRSAVEALGEIGDPSAV